MRSRWRPFIQPDNDQNEPERVQEAGNSGSKHYRRPRSAHTSISHRICRIEFPYTTAGPLVLAFDCPKNVYILRTDRQSLGSVRNMSTNIGQTRPPRRGPNLDLKRAILDRVRRDKPTQVWTPNDFLDLGARSAVDKALQR